MSEYIESHQVSKFIGSPPDYVASREGGQLTEVVRHTPHSLILFDEIDKAHKDIFNVLLQILDNGRLTDNKGKIVDFNNTLIIMTSNIGGDLIVNNEGFEKVKLKVAEQLQHNFTLEFLNRTNQVVMFKPLSKVELTKIVDIMIKEIRQRLQLKKNIVLEVTSDLKKRIVEEGNTTTYGARPLKRTITRLLEDGLAEKILRKDIREGNTVKVDHDSDGDVCFDVE